MKQIRDDIKKLDAQIKELQRKQKMETKNPQNKFVSAYQVGSRVAVELVSGVLVGAAVGYFLDKMFNTQPIMLVIFLIFGGAAGFLNVYRFVHKLNATKE